MQQIYESKANTSLPPKYYHETMLYHTTARNVGKIFFHEKHNFRVFLTILSFFHIFRIKKDAH